VSNYGTAIADRDDLAFGLWKILRKEGCELLTIGWHRKSYLWSKPSLYFRGGSNIKSGLIDFLNGEFLTASKQKPDGYAAGLCHSFEWVSSLQEFDVPY
jgi:hypothetical protein